MIRNLPSEGDESSSKPFESHSKRRMYPAGGSYERYEAGSGELGIECYSVGKRATPDESFGQKLVSSCATDLNSNLRCEHERGGAVKLVGCISRGGITSASSDHYELSSTRDVDATGEEHALAREHLIAGVNTKLPMGGGGVSLSCDATGKESALDREQDLTSSVYTEPSSAEMDNSSGDATGEECALDRARSLAGSVYAELFLDGSDLRCDAAGKERTPDGDRSLASSVYTELPYAKWTIQVMTRLVKRALLTERVPSPVVSMLEYPSREWAVQVLTRLVKRVLLTERDPSPVVSILNHP